MVALFGPPVRKLMLTEYLRYRNVPREQSYMLTIRRSIDLFRKLNWLPFYDELEILKCSIIYRINENAPDYISDMFSRNIDIHSRETGHGHANIVCPRYNHEKGGRSFTVSSGKIWNSLSAELHKKPLRNL